MITIYHNNRCSKSRQGLLLIEESGEDYVVKKYLEDVPTEAELKVLINTLGIQPIDLIRKNESIWKENFKGKALSNAEIIQAMTNYPKLIERPIVVNGNKAVIGRPPEKILEII